MSRNFVWGPSPDDRGHRAAQLGERFGVGTQT
jgi:hypothetical protein